MKNGAGVATGPALGFRPGSCDPGRFPIESNEASSEGLNPGSVKASFDRSLSRFLRPKAPVPPDSGGSGFGFGLRLRLALLLRLPHHCIRDFRPEGLPPLPRWRHSEAFIPKDGGS
jgi:hypothetical protein